MVVVLRGQAWEDSIEVFGGGGKGGKTKSPTRFGVGLGEGFSGILSAVVR
jgi:hypothetical protein